MGITHKWNGTILTITSDSGTSSADLKGDKGDDGVRGVQGIPGIIIGDYATKEYVREYAQPKGTYLTEHQSLAEYAKTSEIPKKPDDIGALGLEDEVAIKEWTTTQIQAAINATWEASY